MEHRKTEVRQATARGASGDNAARFLRELRQLRNGAGLGQAELAARSHYPYDRIRAAEAGPALPDLPVLTAYVRGCGGTTEEWEDRWRSLRWGSSALPLLHTRSAGCSTAAAAGARLSSAAGPAGPNVACTDPSAIRAALGRVAADLAPAPETLPDDTGAAEPENSPAVGAEAAPEVAAAAVALVPAQRAAVPIADAELTPAAVLAADGELTADTGLTAVTVVTADADLTADALPTADAEPAGDGELTVDAELDADAMATADGEPSGDALPAADAELIADAEISSDATPTAAAELTAVTLPTAAAELIAVALPTTDVRWTANARATVAAVPTADARRTAGAVPVTTASRTSGGTLAQVTRRQMPPRLLTALIVVSVCVGAIVILVGVLAIFG